MGKLSHEDIKAILTAMTADNELYAGGVVFCESELIQRYNLTEKQSGDIQGKLYRIVLSMRKL